MIKKLVSKIILVLVNHPRKAIHQTRIVLFAKTMKSPVNKGFLVILITLRFEVRQDKMVAGARNHLVLLFSAIGLAEQRLMA
ncbi:MAG TPA: hypothetical protein DEF07_04280 [Nitrosomonas sp.]|nr:hypothetical protein [Nitrosomonas sp.]